MDSAAMIDHQALEYDRLHYIARHDGEAAMRAFARRTYAQYRTVRRQALREHYGYGEVYRRPLIESCLVFRRVLRAAPDTKAMDGAQDSPAH